MKVLAIDGAFGVFSCAVSVDGTPAAHESAPAGAALEMGLEAIHRALERADLAPVEIDRIAVCTGPGSFTGLRVAISYAKSLAQGWDRPLVGVSAFDVLEGATQDVPRLAVVCAREGIISARLMLTTGELRESGRTAAVCALIADACPLLPLAVAGASEDVLAALGERGILVHSVDAPPPALAIAQLAAARAPARTVHDVRADYGELPPAVVRSS